jgi:5-methyltetrahydrofolate--homocysteine methyltransferase
LLRDQIRSDRILLADGAWGTNLMAAGLDISRDCAEHWNVAHPEEVTRLAEAFVEAGADILTTNTFGGNPIRLAKFGYSGQISEINRQGVRLVREAAGTNRIVAAAVGPTGIKDIAARSDEIARAFDVQGEILVDAGVDIIVLETMTSPEEARLAIDAFKKISSIDLVCSYAFRRLEQGDFVTWSGATVREALQVAIDSGADVVGMNCYPANEHLGELLTILAENGAPKPIWLKPNAGTIELGKNEDSYPWPVHQIPLSKEVLRGANVSVLGGCCGTTPADIQKLGQLLHYEPLL